MILGELKDGTFILQSDAVRNHGTPVPLYWKLRSGRIVTMREDWNLLVQHEAARLPSDTEIVPLRTR